MNNTYLKSLICMFTVTSLLISSCSSIPSTAEYESLLEKSLDHGFPGIILAIQRDQEIMWIGAKGVSNIEQQIPMQTDDRFHLASVTKIFTATAILKLIDQGTLSLTSKVVDILDSALVSPIPHINEIQIYQLLDHSSGIYGFNNDMEYIHTLIGNRVQDKIIWSPEELIALAYGQRVDPAGKPGSGHYYGDTNYCLLGLIVEKISGMPLRRYVKENILDPLRMFNTGYYSENTDSAKVELQTSVQGYLQRSEDLDALITLDTSFKEVSDGLVNTTTAVERIDAAAGMVSTAQDLLKFGRALYFEDLLSPKSLEWLLSIGNSIENDEVGTKRQGVVSVRHMKYGILYLSLGDGPGGVNTMLAYHQERKSIVVAFVNVFGQFDEHDYFINELLPVILSEFAQ